MFGCCISDAHRYMHSMLEFWVFHYVLAMPFLHWLQGASCSRCISSWVDAKTCASLLIFRYVCMFMDRRVISPGFGRIKRLNVFPCFPEWLWLSIVLCGGKPNSGTCFALWQAIWKLQSVTFWTFNIQHFHCTYFRDRNCAPFHSNSWDSDLRKCFPQYGFIPGAQ